MSSVRWVWAEQPCEEQLALARAIEAGALPPSAEIVQEKGPRRVWRVPDVAGGVLLKHFAVAPSEGYVFLVRPSRARREFHVMEAFRLRGVPSVRALGFGERWSGGRLAEAWFLGRLVPNAQTLSGVMEARAPEERRVLTRQALEVVAVLHDQPYLHRDLHAGNVLLDGEGRMLIIDLHSAWRVPRLTPGMRAHNLARLLWSLRRWVSLDETSELLRGYAALRGEDLGDLVARFEGALAAYERDYTRGRVARCLRTGSGFAVERLGPSRVFRSRSYEREELERDLAAPAEAVLESAPHGGVARVGDRILKRYTARAAAGRWRQRMGQGRARSAWVGCRRLALRGIPTPEGLALVEHADGSAVLVTRVLEPVESLRAYVDRLDPDPRAPDHGRIMSAVGHVVGRLARAGLRHHDLSTKNLLIVRGPPPRSRDIRTQPPAGWPVIHLIDLDNMRTTKPYDEAALERMLGQLGDVPACISTRDRLRFLKGYERSAGRPVPAGVLVRAEERVRRRQERRARQEAVR